MQVTATGVASPEVRARITGWCLDHKVKAVIGWSQDRFRIQAQGPCLGPLKDLCMQMQDYRIDVSFKGEGYE